MTFTDRFHAGRLLAAELVSYRGRTDVILLGLARGGVLVAYEVATYLQVPLDVLVVRKIGLPNFPEMAIGAIAPDGIEILPKEATEDFAIPPDLLQAAVHAERRKLQQRTHRFRQDRPYPDLHDKVAILIDDGLATGQTMRAAIAWARNRDPREIVVAVPIGAVDVCRMMEPSVDRLVCLSSPPDFHAVGQAYEDFHPVTDGEVVTALEDAAKDLSFSPSAAANLPGGHGPHPTGEDIPFVKTARIKFSSPQVAEIGLTNGRMVRIAGEAAREPINAITSATESPHYHSTFGVPLESGDVLVVAVDGKHLEAIFRN